MSAPARDADADFDVALDAAFGPSDASTEALIAASIDVHAAAMAAARAAVPDVRLNEILDHLNNVLIRTLYYGPDTILANGEAVRVAGDYERDWDATEFAAYARTLPELDVALADDLEGEIPLIGGTVLWFDRGGPSWEPTLSADRADESQPSMVIGRAAI